MTGIVTPPNVVRWEDQVVYLLNAWAGNNPGTSVIDVPSPQITWNDKVLALLKIISGV